MKQQSLFEYCVVVMIYADGTRKSREYEIERAEAFCYLAHEAGRDSSNPLVHLFINIIA
jgi:hypothetical protein